MKEARLRFTGYWAFLVAFDRRAVYLFWPMILVFAPREHRLRVLTAAVVLAPLFRVLHMEYRARTGVDIFSFPVPRFLLQHGCARDGMPVTFLQNANKLPSSTRITIADACSHYHCHRLAERQDHESVGIRPHRTSARQPDDRSNGGDGKPQNLCGDGKHLLRSGNSAHWLGRLSYSIYIWQQYLLLIGHRISSSHSIRSISDVH